MKAKVAAEEALRLLLYALNGLAALSVIDKDIPAAISQYREVRFQSCRNHSTLFFGQASLFHICKH